MPPTAVSTTTEPPTKASKQSEENATGQSGSAERRRRRYVWKVVSFSSCSKSCGGGTLSPIIRCVRDGTPNKFFNHKRCTDQDKPVLNENVLRCNTQPCPAYWKIEEWSACNCGLPNEHEHQTREIKCVQELASGVVIQVVEAACLDDQPPIRQNCVCPKAPNNLSHHQHHTKRNHHNHQHTKGSFRAPVTLIGNSTIGKRVHVTENKNAGSWLSAEWGDECPTKCGDGVQYRSIFCDRSHPNTERCDLRQTPDTSRQCTASKRCDLGDWFTGSWSKCSGDCFSLARSRAVYCIKNKQIVADTECIDPNDAENTSKPLATEACEIDDVTYCKPRWHYSEWTEVISIFALHYILFAYLPIPTFAILRSARRLADRAHNDELSNAWNRIQKKSCLKRPTIVAIPNDCKHSEIVTRTSVKMPVMRPILKWKRNDPSPADDPPNQKLNSFKTTVCQVRMGNQ